MDTDTQEQAVALGGFYVPEGDAEVIGDVQDRLGNGRPPCEPEHFEGTAYQDEDGYYDRYEVGESHGSLDDGGVRFAVLDYLGGGTYVVTVQRKQGGFDEPLPLAGP